MSDVSVTPQRYRLTVIIYSLICIALLIGIYTGWYSQSDNEYALTPIATAPLQNGAEPNVTHITGTESGDTHQRDLLQQRIQDLEADLHALDARWSRLSREVSASDWTAQERAERVLEKINDEHSEARGFDAHLPQILALFGLGTAFADAFQANPHEWTFDEEQELLNSLLALEHLNSEHFESFSCYQSICEVSLQQIPSDDQAAIQSYFQSIIAPFRHDNDFKATISTSPENEQVRIFIGRGND
ncbi:hypothetical protein FM042_06660 [Aliidiomarina halalkaliphila]|uniref:Uncharacterized protein n=1 Tax=Aliidiomarina halalkaliphila TaxID=2593535 RepID=A0A552X0T0_9GAMM|nr:hypothetical protein [Aliidiomarina halalkaliphila]TRW48662.1 hypothetical protein FM042_06660 [Aliidiomarina halalkaliphila]